MSNRPDISVIILSFNDKQHLKQTLNSVTEQTLKNIEILCVDGGSDDGTLDLLKDYSKQDSRIHVFLANRNNYGMQINQGLTNAHGVYVSIIEAGDYIEKNMFESLYNLTQVRYIDIVKANFYKLNKIGEETKIELDTSNKSLLKIEKAFKIGTDPEFLEGNPSIWSAIYKRSFLIHKDIKFIEGDPWVSVPFFYETALKANTIVYTDKPYYYHRKDKDKSSPTKITNLNSSVKRIKDIFKVLNEDEDVDIEIKKLLYDRLFKCVEKITAELEKSEEKLDYEATLAIHDVLRNVDLTYVHEKLSKKNKQIYFKFVSPLILAKFDDN